METIQFAIDIVGTNQEIGELQKLQAQIDTLVASQKKLKTNSQTNTAQYQKQAIQLKETKTAYRNLQNSVDRTNKTFVEEKNTLRSVSSQLSILRQKIKDVEIGGKSYDKIAAKIKNLEAVQRKHNQTVGRGTTFIGEYTKGAISGFKQMAVAAIGFMAVYQGIKKALGTIIDFEKSMAKVKAVSNATNEEFARLSKLSRDLGSSTEYTASQVAQLELEYSKLGFSVKEIEGVTAATLDLATATDSELGRSAEVVGNTLRAFEMDVSKAGHLTDVMAKSFSSSALDMEKFATAMSTVAPVAKNANVSLEETTSMIGILVDRGVDASTAGTALRNIFLELSKQGISYSDAMSQINEATDKNAVALELFGKRGATVASILAETGVQVDALTVKLEDSDGAASQMAETMRDTLSGDIDKLTSAMEGAVLDGASPMNAVFRTIIQTLTSLVKNLDSVLLIIGTYIASTKLAALYTTLFSKSAGGAATGVKKIAASFG